MFLINTGYPPVGASGMATRIPRRNPNNINLSRTDAKVALAPCPLNKPTMQLVPLRYGLARPCQRTVDGASPEQPPVGRAPAS